MKYHMAPKKWYFQWNCTRLKKCSHPEYTSIYSITGWENKSWISARLFFNHFFKLSVVHSHYHRVSSQWQGLWLVVNTQKWFFLHRSTHWFDLIQFDLTWTCAAAVYCVMYLRCRAHCFDFFSLNDFCWIYLICLKMSSLFEALLHWIEYEWKLRVN